MSYTLKTNAKTKIFAFIAAIALITIAGILGFALGLSSCTLLGNIINIL